MAKKEAWRIRWEAECARYYKTPGGAATKALFEAAEKAGMAARMGGAGIEVIVETYEGKTGCYRVYEAENHEREGWELPRAEWERAKKWLAAYAARKGWECTTWYYAA